jgi:hypothetical protein
MRFVFHLVSLVSCAASLSARADVVVDFEDLKVPVSGHFNGDPGSLPPGQSVNTPWTSAGVSFSNTFGIDSYGGFDYEYWYGFSYSNAANTTNPAFENQYASYPGGGYQSSRYAVAYADGATITLPVATTVAGMWIANTTYAALTMRDGDQYGFAAPLPAGGWFATTATGKLAGVATDTATFYLADLRGGSAPGIRATWAWFDLTALGTVDTIEFAFDGSDQGTFGLNTPAYFAMDDLTVTAVPEPATWPLLAAGAATMLLAARRSAWARRASRGG